MKLLLVVCAAVGAITATISNQALNTELFKNRARFRNGNVQRVQRRRMQRQRTLDVTAAQSKTAFVNMQAKFVKRRRAMSKFAQMMALVNSYKQYH